MTALLARIFVDYSVEFVPREDDVEYVKHIGLGQNWVEEKSREVTTAHVQGCIIELTSATVSFQSNI